MHISQEQTKNDARLHITSLVINTLRPRVHGFPTIAGMLSPAILVLVVLQVYPGLYSIYLAFHRQRQQVEQFVGLDNFHILFRMPQTWESIRHTLVYTSAYVILTTVLSLGLALLLHRNLSITPLSMVLLFLPWVLSDVVAGTIWRWLFLRDYGLLQTWLEPFVHQTLLADTTGAMFIVIASSVWRSLALGTLLLLASLRSIPREMTECATLDGARSHQILWSITFPLIRPHILIVVLMLSIRAMNSPGLILTITGGGPARATSTLSLYLYQQFWQFGDFGSAAALAVIMLVMNIGLTAGYVATIHKR